MPTLNQKAVFNDVIRMVEKGRKVSVSRIMREQGYSLAASSHPQRLTRSKGWQALMSEVPDYLLISILRRNIEQRKNIMASNKAIHIALKLKNKYPPSKVQVVDTSDNISSKELDEELKQLEAERLKRMREAQKNKSVL